MPDTGGNDDRLCLMLALLGDDGLIFTVVDYAGDCLHFYLGALMNDLLDELIGKLIAAHLDIAGIILYLRRKGYLTAERAFLKNEDGFIGAQRIKGGGEACRTRADNYNIIHFRQSLL